MKQKAFNESKPALFDRYRLFQLSLFWDFFFLLSPKSLLIWKKHPRISPSKWETTSPTYSHGLKQVNPHLLFSKLIVNSHFKIKENLVLMKQSCISHIIEKPRIIMENKWEVSTLPLLSTLTSLWNLLSSLLFKTNNLRLPWQTQAKQRKNNPSFSDPMSLEKGLSKTH